MASEQGSPSLHLTVGCWNPGIDDEWGDAKMNLTAEAACNFVNGPNVDINNPLVYPRADLMCHMGVGRHPSGLGKDAISRWKKAMASRLPQNYRHKVMAPYSLEADSELISMTSSM